MNRNQFNNQLLTLIETENLYEDYTGRRYGYKFKSEYQYKKTQSESIYHRISIVCREIMPDSPQVNVEINISCAPLGIFEKFKFITDDIMTSEGSEKFCESIVRQAFSKKSILKQSQENESKQK